MKNHINIGCFSVFCIIWDTKGEALTLAWNEIDFKRNTVRVNKTMSYGEK